MNPIQRYRLAKGLTRAQLAALVGVNINSVVKWEKGALPRGGKLAKVAEVLGVDALRLLDEIEAWKQHKTEAA